MPGSWESWAGGCGSFVVVRSTFRRLGVGGHPQIQTSFTLMAKPSSTRRPLSSSFLGLPY